MENDINALISCLITRRKELGITQKQLAEITGLSFATINRVENFQLSPRLEVFVKICSALKLKLKLTAPK